MPVQEPELKSPRLYTMPNDDKIWAMFSSYIYVTAKQAAEILGCNHNTIQVRLRRLFQAKYLDREQKNPFSDFVYFLTEKGGEKCAERGFFEMPRWIQKKSIITLDHDCEITDFHMRLEKATANYFMIWHQWRGQLAKEFGDYIPDAHFCLDGWKVLEIVRSYASTSADLNSKKKGDFVQKLKTYDKEKRHVLVVMPTQMRVANFLAKIEDELPSSRLWFTDEASYRKDILGKIWWTPKNFRDRQYSILKPEA